MSMNTEIMIRRVRESIFEMQETVITDGMILRLLNKGYRYAYDVFAKSNSSYISSYESMKLETGRNKYPLPKGLHNKRITSIDAEYWASDDDRIGLERVNWSKMKQLIGRYTVPAHTPSLWAILGNYIYFYPAAGVKVWITSVPEIIELGHMVGKVVSYKDDELELSSISNIDEKLKESENIVSVCGGDGSVKHLLYVESIEGTTLKLGKHPSREVYEGAEITNISKESFDYCEYDYSTDIVKVYGTFTGLSKGDYVQLDFIPELYGEYITENSLKLDLDLPDNLAKGTGYSPADAVFPKSPFSKSFYSIKEVKEGYIEIIDPDFEPLVIDGKVHSDHSATVSVGTGCKFLSETDFEVTGTFAGALTIGDEYELTFQSTGILQNFTTPATWDGTKFIATYGVPYTDSDSYDAVSYVDDTSIIQTATPTYPQNEGYTIAVLDSSHDWGNAGDTIRLTFSATYDLSASIKKYVEATIISPTRVRLTKPIVPELGFASPTILSFATGIPRLLEYNLSFQDVSLLQVLGGTPDLGDEEFNILPDDVVTLGKSTGKCILGENIPDFLIDYACISLRGSLNEMDRDLQRSLDLLFRQLHTDIGGRELDLRIKRETPLLRSRVGRCRGAR